MTAMRYLSELLSFCKNADKGRLARHFAHDVVIGVFYRDEWGQFSARKNFAAFVGISPTEDTSTQRVALLSRYAGVNSEKRVWNLARSGNDFQIQFHFLFEKA